jgi:hypothetical protein
MRKAHQGHRRRDGRSQHPTRRFPRRMELYHRSEAPGWMMWLFGLKPLSHPDPCPTDGVHLSIDVSLMRVVRTDNKGAQHDRPRSQERLPGSWPLVDRWRGAQHSLRCGRAGSNEWISLQMTFRRLQGPHKGSGRWRAVAIFLISRDRSALARRPRFDGEEHRKLPASPNYAIPTRDAAATET